MAGLSGVDRHDGVLRRVLPPPGPVVATERCSGRVGRLVFSGGMITATAYTDRLTLRVKLMSGVYTILGSEIRSVAETGRLRRQVRQGVRQVPAELV